MRCKTRCLPAVPVRFAILRMLLVGKSIASARERTRSLHGEVFCFMASANLAPTFILTLIVVVWWRG